jgi:hypothetical protein
VQSWHILTFSPRISRKLCLPNETTKILGHCSGLPGQDSNLVLPEQETGVLGTRQWWSVQGLKRVITDDESSKARLRSLGGT